MCLVLETSRLLLSRDGMMRLDGATMTIQSPSETHPYFWEEVCEAAALEVDTARFQERVSAAEGTMMARLLEPSNRPEHEAEARAAEKAIRALWTVKQELSKILRSTR